MKLTKETFIQGFKKHKETLEATGCYKSPIRFIFNLDVNSYQYEEFEEDNWNGYDILRSLLLANWGKQSNLYHIYYYRICDQTTIFLMGAHYFYEISWYKSRGQTEKIYRDGMGIDIDDYINLYNYLKEEWEETE